jgi:hypothetical protein
MELLHYNPETGIFTWLVSPRSGWAGKTAGYDENGYVALKIGATKYKAHRLAWFYIYGEWPSGMLDHINLNKADNRIANLRVVTFQQNAANRPAQYDNASGLKGVHWHKQSRKWRAQANIQGRRTHLGLFDTKEAAHAAYVRAARAIYGEYARG